VWGEITDDYKSHLAEKRVYLRDPDVGMCIILKWISNVRRLKMSVGLNGSG
jgi:hypothetical protein